MHEGLASKDIEALFDDVLASYPADLAPMVRANRSRMVWQVTQVAQRVPSGGTLLDIGAGVVPFMLMCARLGYHATVVDDLADGTYATAGTAKVLDLFEAAGVAVVQGDTFAGTAEQIFAQRYDLVTSHDSMEHWHHSPKLLFHRLWECLNPGGIFWIGVPNCVNLRKRITVPLGRGKWSQMKDWYEPVEFRGHVREPDVDDLLYIARDLGATDVEVVGKNWLGYRHPSKFIRRSTPFVDRALQLRPSLCSDLNLFATKR